MAHELTYIPTEVPAAAFKVGDQVEVLDRNHKVIGEQTIKAVLKTRVKTNCGRAWTKEGEWFDGQCSYPFPSIRQKQ